MSNIWIVKFDEKCMHFTSEYARALFLDYRKENKDERYRLIPDKKYSREQQGFYYGAVIPSFAEWSDNYDENNPDHLLQIHDLMKLEFNGTFLTNLAGKSTKIGKSTTSMNKKDYSAFLERIEHYYDQNQIPFPSAELYLRWVDEFSIDYPKYRDWLKAMNLKVNGDPIEI